MMEIKDIDKDRGLENIPSGWKIKRIDEFADIKIGGTPTRKESKYWENGIHPWVSISDVSKSNKYLFNTKEKITDEGIQHSNVKLIPKNSVLMTFKLTLGKLVITARDVFTNEAIAAILPNNPEQLITDYLYYALNNVDYERLVDTAVKGKTLNKSKLSEIKMLIPPLKEQQKIAEILSTVDEQIEQTDQLIEKTKELKKGLMQQLLTKGIGHTEFKQTELGEIPVEWEIKKLEEISIFKNGQAHENKVSKDGNFILVNSKFISTEGRIYKKVSENLSPLEIDDITMVMSDLPNGKAFAKCFLVPINDKYTLNQRICAITPKEVNPKFLYYQLNRNKYFMKYDNGVGQTNLKKIEVLECPILIPSTDEQQKIAKILTSVDEDIEGYEEEKEKYEELKKGLMQQLLTGKTRVKVD